MAAEPAFRFGLPACLTAGLLAFLGFGLWAGIWNPGDSVWHAEMFAADDAMRADAPVRALYHADNALKIAVDSGQTLVAAQRAGSAADALGMVIPALGYYLTAVHAGQYADSNYIPEFLASLNGLAENQVQAGDFQAAEAFARRAAALSSEPPLIRRNLLNLAQIYIQTGRWAKSEGLLGALLPKLSVDEGALYLRGVLLLGQLRRVEGRLVEAEQIVQAVIASFSEKGTQEDDPIFFEPLLLLAEIRNAADQPVDSLIPFLDSMAQKLYFPMHPKRVRLRMLKTDAGLKHHVVEAARTLNLLDSAVHEQFGSHSPWIQEVNRMRFRSENISSAQSLKLAQEGVDFWMRHSLKAGEDLPPLALAWANLRDVECRAGVDCSISTRESKRLTDRFQTLFQSSATAWNGAVTPLKGEDHE